MSNFEWSEKKTHELYDELDRLDGMIQRTVKQAMNDGRPSIDGTPILSMQQKYEEHYYNVQTELIDRKEI